MVRVRNSPFPWALVCFMALRLAAAPRPAGNTLSPVSRAHLCVTEGAIEELPGPRLAVNVPKMRAYLNSRTPQSVEADFTYLGSTGNEARLASGELRRQFGLKLRAQDACNLVYAMWRIEPESKLVVSVKNNPGLHSSAQCGNRGYRNICSTSWPSAFASSGNERRGNESLRRQRARVGRFDRVRSTQLRWTRWHAFRQRSAAG